jgi:hypothetical protein
MESANYYVGINEPVELRRKVLEASRNVLRNLQIYEEIRVMRSERLSAQSVLSSQIKELKSIVAKLRKCLPKAELKSPERKEKNRNMPRGLEELEQEIAAVESSLKGMG